MTSSVSPFPALGAVLDIYLVLLLGALGFHLDQGFSLLPYYNWLSKLYYCYIKHVF